MRNFQFIEINQEGGAQSYRDELLQHPEQLENVSWAASSCKNYFILKMSRCKQAFGGRFQSGFSWSVLVWNDSKL